MNIHGLSARNKPVSWSSDIAYAVGLLATDGCLLSDGRHLDLTSTDVEQLENFSKCINRELNITYKTSGYTDKLYPRLQFSDVVLYKFLTKVGLTPSKTKSLGELKIPKEYYFDFLRGHLDGDGTFYSYWDKRWKSSFMFYTVLISASKKYINWLRRKNNNLLGISGHICRDGKKKSIYQLKYAKKESLRLLRKVYYNNEVTCLSRKRLKIEEALSIIGESL